MLDYALKYLSHGFVCVPLTRNGRHLDLPALGYDPLHLQTRRNKLKELCFSSITFELSQHPPSAAVLQGWFAKCDGNIGIIGGHQNLLVLDFDHPSAFRRWQKLNPKLAASTPVAQSPKGFHVYLRTVQPVISSSLHLGFQRAGHIKALGGYVVSPPSRLANGGIYQWLPGQSPFDLAPQTVENLRSLSVRTVSPLKEFYDRFMNRGGFEPN